MSFSSEEFSAEDFSPEDDFSEESDLQSETLDDIRDDFQDKLNKELENIQNKALKTNEKY